MVQHSIDLRRAMSRALAQRTQRLGSPAFGASAIGVGVETLSSAPVAAPFQQRGRGLKDFSPRLQDRRRKASFANVHIFAFEERNFSTE
jgi:hypothetical protein